MPHHSPRASLSYAGKGSRGLCRQHKVCFEVDGRPVINRALENYLVRYPPACGGSRRLG